MDHCMPAKPNAGDCGAGGAWIDVANGSVDGRHARAAR